MFINAIIALVATLPIILFRAESIKTVLNSDKTALALIVISTILAIVANFFIFSSIKLLDASTASILEISYPFFVILFTMLFFRTVPNLYFFLGAVLIFFGSLIIIKLA